MKCPKCGESRLKVNEKRDLPAESAIRRRRECESCGHRFTTYERIEIPLLMVVKRNGEREPYLREKMAQGIKKALKKRPFDAIKVEEIVDSIDREINQRLGGEIPSTEVGDLVSQKLKSVDDVAYLRFVSVYKSFADIDTFEKEVNRVKCGKDKC